MVAAGIDYYPTAQPTRGFDGVAEEIVARHEARGLPANRLTEPGVCNTLAGMLAGGELDHGAACALCCLAQAGASLDSPPQLAFSVPLRHAERVSWRAAEVTLVAADKGSNTQARAPPHLS